MARRHAKKIQSVVWKGIGAVFESLVNGATAAFAVLSAQTQPETILRIRGEWLAGFANPLAPDTGATVRVGLILVPEGTGTTVLWAPGTDVGAPWIWWDALTLLYAEAVTDVIGSQMTAGGRRVIDSKAMRIRRNQELQCVIENTTVGSLTTASVMADVQARVLVGS